MDDNINEQINNYLLKTFKMTDVLEFDKSLKNMFEDVFYSIENEDVLFRLPTTHSTIFQFFKYWKSLQEYSGITNACPTILTGAYLINTVILVVVIVEAERIFLLAYKK